MTGRRLQQYKAEWETEKDCNGTVVGRWCLPHSKKENYARCKWCDCSVSISHTGKEALLHHADTKKHKKLDKANNSTIPLDNFVQRKEKSLPIDDQVLEAEIRWGIFSAENDLSSNLSQDVCDLFSVMFPSEVAQKYSSSRTKNTYMITDGLSFNFHKRLVECLKETKFSILLDESNKKHGTKYLHILVKYYNNDLGKAVTQFYKAIVVNQATAGNIVSAINSTLDEDGIPWTNVIQVMSDSPNVMRGQKGGVLTLIKQEYAPNLVDIGGCALHHIHNSASYATEKLGDEIEEFAVDVFAFFKHRTGLIEEYKYFQEILELPEHKIMRFVSTRWLSILPIAKRLLEQWSALKSFFVNLGTKHPNIAKTERAIRLKNSLNNPLLEAMLEFLCAALPQLEKFEKLFQCKDTKIHLLYDEMAELLRSLMNQFVKPSALEGITTGERLIKVNYKDIKNQLSDSALFTGIATEKILKDRIADGDKKRFYLSVRDFYQTVVAKLIHYLPFGNTLLKDLRCLNPDSQNKQYGLSAVKRLGSTLSNIDQELDVDSVVSEWHMYVAVDLSAIREKNSRNGYLDINGYWTDISSMELPGGDSKFENLTKLMKMCMCFAHGNADTERSFSQSCQILTDKRNRLGIETLNGLLTIKSELDVYNYKASDIPITPKMLDDCRDAHSRYKKRLEYAENQEKLKQTKEQQQIEREKFLKSLQQESNKHGLKEKELIAEEMRKEQHDLIEKANHMMKHAQTMLKDAAVKASEFEKVDKEVKKIKEKVLSSQLKRGFTSKEKLDKNKKQKLDNHRIDTMMKGTESVTSTKQGKKRILSPAKKASGKKTSKSQADSLETDLIAKSFLPQNYKTYRPLKCSGNGNCLFNAVSVLIEGNESLAGELRQKAALELETSCVAYSQHPSLQQAANKMQMDMLSSLQTVAEIPAGCPDDSMTIVKKEARKTREDKYWSSMLQVYALSTVLNCNITSVFPDVEHYARPTFHTIVKPIRDGAPFTTKKVDIVIMWSRSNLDRNSSIFVTDHVVPLVKINQK